MTSSFYTWYIYSEMKEKPLFIQVLCKTTLLLSPDTHRKYNNKKNKKVNPETIHNNTHVLLFKIKYILF